MISFYQYGEDDYAPYSPMGQCDTHGLEQIAGERIISTGIDKCVVDVFVCGVIDKSTVF